MDEQQRNLLYRQMADSFINLANNHAEQQNPFMVASAMLYGTARYSAFVTAIQAKEQAQYEADREAAIDYFMTEFRRMLNENLDSYRSVFVQSEERSCAKPQSPEDAEVQQILSYDRLMKSEK